MKEFFQRGPLQILQEIAAAFSSEHGPDGRAVVTVQSPTGTTWTGVPALYQRDNKGDFFALINHKTKETIVLYIDQIAGILVSDENQLDSFLRRPWLTDARFGAISKLQFLRDAETEWKDIGAALQIKVDTFPKDEYIFGAALAWIVALKAELHRIIVGFPEALAGCKSFELNFADTDLSATKAGDVLKISCRFNANAFDRKKISEALNKSL